MIEINYHHNLLYHFHPFALGPHKRLAIWFQGCNLHCKGCCNPDYQAFEIKNLLTLDALVDIIRDAKEKHGIEGVTYLGGEPTMQQNLPSLTARIKVLGLGVIAFTGHLYEDVADALIGCDLVIDGEFQQENLDLTRKILGSKNQRLIHLTDRYAANEDWFFQDGKTVEINVGTIIFANGDKM